MLDLFPKEFSIKKTDDETCLDLTISLPDAESSNPRPIYVSGPGYKRGTSGGKLFQDGTSHLKTSAFRWESLLTTLIQPCENSLNGKSIRSLL